MTISSVAASPLISPRKSIMSKPFKEEHPLGENSVVTVDGGLLQGAVWVCPGYAELGQGLIRTNTLVAIQRAHPIVAQSVAMPLVRRVHCINQFSNNLNSWCIHESSPCRSKTCISLTPPNRMKSAEKRKSEAERIRAKYP